jgi:hypothetical protein
MNWKVLASTLVAKIQNVTMLAAFEVGRISKEKIFGSDHKVLILALPLILFAF